MIMVKLHDADSNPAGRRCISPAAASPFYPAAVTARRQSEVRTCFISVVALFYRCLRMRRISHICNISNVDI